MRHKPRAKVLLSTAAWKIILLDAHRRQGIEACGALLGWIEDRGDWHVEEAHPLRNTAASPVYFEFDPAELLSIDLEQPGRVIGVYHSHPSGPVRASSTDRGNMRRVNLEQLIPWVWLIVSGPFSCVSEGETVQGEGIGPMTTISARGLIAYHYYQNTGLQKIVIEESREEDDRPPQHP
jgi:proteasome lid subunit RPN8/RPN11